MGHAEPFGQSENFRARIRARRANGKHARYLCRNHSHEQRGRQRIPSGRNIGGHGIQGTNDLSQTPAIAIVHEAFAGHLGEGVLTDIAGCDFGCGPQLRGQRPCYRDSNAFAGEAIEFAGIFEERPVAALADVGKNRRYNFFCLAQFIRIAPLQ